MVAETSFYRENQTLINCKGKLIDLSTPRVMGIVNLTPDSFHEKSRRTTLDEILPTVEQMLLDGADFIDLGPQSTRPGAQLVGEDEELRRIEVISGLIERLPQLLISIDTFRAKVAASAVAQGACMVNDVSGGDLDEAMFDTVARLNVPYVLMHMRGTPETMNTLADYDDLLKDVSFELSQKISRLNKLGVKDIIVDPGFGFAKSLEQNFELLRHLDQFQILGRPVLVGISRKSMINKTLSISSSEALNGTTVLNTLALEKGAGILRVHDVKQASEVVKLHRAYTGLNS